MKMLAFWQCDRLISLLCETKLIENINIRPFQIKSNALVVFLVTFMSWC